MSLKLQLGKTYRDLENFHWEIVEVYTSLSWDEICVGKNNFDSSKRFFFQNGKFVGCCSAFDLIEQVHEIANPIPRKVVDPVVEQVCQELPKRSETGIKKYGITLHDNPLSRKEWLQHAKEESLDLALYLQKLINIEDEETGPSDFNIEEHAKAISTARWDSLSTGTKNFFMEVAERSICHLREKGVRV